MTAVAGTEKVTTASAAPVVAAVVQEADTKFTVQIASFKDRKKAEEALARILKNVPSAYLSEQNLGDKGTWYRVYAGRFNVRSDAEISLNDIKRNYTDSFIISPKKAK
jgi:cell division septation protein DedD